MPDPTSTFPITRGARTDPRSRMPLRYTHRALVSRKKKKVDATNIDLPCAERLNELFRSLRKQTVKEAPVSAQDTWLLKEVRNNCKGWMRMFERAWKQHADRGFMQGRRTPQTQTRGWRY